MGLFAPLGSVMAAEDAFCAKVKIEILQELTLERQGFEATMRISNGLDTFALENVAVDILFNDENDNPVVATSDPNASTADFYIRLDDTQNITGVAQLEKGSISGGRVAPSSEGEIRWLIIPVPGAAKNNPTGKLYFVGAKLAYSYGGKQDEVIVAPDTIIVKPLPKLTLDYFLTEHVFADDAFTDVIEPIEPYTLGIRLANNGFGTANNVKLDSAQPTIVENDQGLAIGFNIAGSYVNDAPAEPSLLLDFGDIPASGRTMGRWVMETTLSGKFTEFTASVSHAAEFGGELTSIIDGANTHFLIRNVQVDMEGRDPYSDFLAHNGNADELWLYESENLGIELPECDDCATVFKMDGSLSTAVQTPSGTQQVLTPASQETQFSFIKIPDPHQGNKVLSRTVRSDGKILLDANAWSGKERNENKVNFDYFIYIFDQQLPTSYTLLFDDVNDIPQPPAIQFISDQTTQEGEQVGFLVRASDLNGDTVNVTIKSLPLGAEFSYTPEQPLGKGIFNWTPTIGQAGNYPVTFIANDGSQTTEFTMNIVVNVAGDFDGDGLVDSWELEHFGDLNQDGTGDFDRDGIPNSEDDEPVGSDISAAQLQVAALTMQADQAQALSFANEYAFDPIVITGAPTARSGFAVMAEISDLTSADMNVAMVNLDQAGVTPENEVLPYLAMLPGRYLSAGNFAWEAGRFNINADSITTSFTSAFDGIPKVFVTLQSSHNNVPLLARVIQVSEEGFEVQLENTEIHNGRALADEIIGYVAVYEPTESGVTSVHNGISISATAYDLNNVSLDSEWSEHNSTFMQLREETTADQETLHELETVSLLTINENVFAQVMSYMEIDPVTIVRDEDTDGDTQPNHLDTDDDGDNVADELDAFPLDSSETTDTDNDGYGDNTDAFINNANEWLDSDADGMGNNYENQYGLNNNLSDSAANQDIEPDNLTNLEEFLLGTDPTLADTDGDALNDDVDSYPLDPNLPGDSGTDPEISLPVIIEQPVSSVSITDGGLMSLAVEATDAVNHQWQKNGFDLMGETSATLSTVVTLADNGSVYSVILSNSVGSVTSSDTTLTVTEISSGAAITSIDISSDLQSPQEEGAVVTFTLEAIGGSGNYEYKLIQNDYAEGINNLLQDWSTNNTIVWDTTDHTDTNFIKAYARNVGQTEFFYVSEGFSVSPNDSITGLNIVSDAPSPQQEGTVVTFTLEALGGSGDYEYKLIQNDYAEGINNLLQDWSTSNTVVWDTTGHVDTSFIKVYARNVGQTEIFYVSEGFSVSPNDSITGLNIVSDAPSPQQEGTVVTFTLEALGGSGDYEYKLIQNDYAEGINNLLQDWSTSNTVVWDTTGHVDTSFIKVYARNVGQTEVFYVSEEFNVNAATNELEPLEIIIGFGEGNWTSFTTPGSFYNHTVTETGEVINGIRTFESAVTKDELKDSSGLDVGSITVLTPGDLSGPGYTANATAGVDDYGPYTALYSGLSVAPKGSNVSFSVNGLDAGVNYRVNMAGRSYTDVENIVNVDVNGVLGSYDSNGIATNVTEYEKVVVADNNGKLIITLSSDGTTAADKWGISYVHINKIIDGSIADIPVAPIMTHQPEHVSVTQGASATFTVAATSHHSIQWYRDGVVISGETASNYTLITGNGDDGAIFTAVVTNEGGSTTSDSAVLSLLTDMPIIIDQPVSTLAIMDGDLMTLSVSATGVVNYQWQLNGVDIVGATNATFSTPVALTDTGSVYNVVVSNPFGYVASDESTLTVMAIVQQYWFSFGRSDGKAVAYTSSFSSFIPDVKAEGVGGEDINFIRSFTESPLTRSNIFRDTAGNVTDLSMTFSNIGSDTASINGWGDMNADLLLNDYVVNMLTNKNLFAHTNLYSYYLYMASNQIMQFEFTQGGLIAGDQWKVQILGMHYQDAERPVDVLINGEGTPGNMQVGDWSGMNMFDHIATVDANGKLTISIAPQVNANINAIRLIKTE